MECTYLVHLHSVQLPPYSCHSKEFSQYLLQFTKYAVLTHYTVCSRVKTHQFKHIEVYTVHSTVYTVKSAEYIVQTTVYTVFGTVHSIVRPGTEYAMVWPGMPEGQGGAKPQEEAGQGIIMCSLQCCVQCVVFSVYCTYYTMQCVLCSVYCVNMGSTVLCHDLSTIGCVSCSVLLYVCSQCCAVYSNIVICAVCKM